MRGQGRYQRKADSQGVCVGKVYNDEYVTGTWREIHSYMKDEYPHIKCQDVNEMIKFLVTSAKEKS